MLRHLTWMIAVLTMLILAPSISFAEYDDPYYTPPAEPTQQQYRQPRYQRRQQTQQQQQRNEQRNEQQPKRRYYFTNDEPRTDSGVFHVAFAVGGNFWIEPELFASSYTPTGGTFEDFGFTVGAVFDWDYSELDENIPLMLRGMINYKYILSSTNVFGFDGVVRYMWRFSDRASFGFGIGASAAIWHRADIASTAAEETIFLPSMIFEAGFEFDPFMVEFKWMINKLGEDANRFGFELNFGIRL